MPATLPRVGLLLAVLALLGSPPHRAVAAAPHPLRTGVSYVYDDTLPAFEHVRRAGGRLVLTPLEWAIVAPVRQPAVWQPENPADPNYEWSHYDRWVANAVAAGLTPVLQVRGAPTWAQHCQATELDSPCEPDPAALAAFTTAAVRRYGGSFAGLPRVAYWQGLNEPNLSLFLSPQFREGKAVSAGIYRTLVNAFYAAVKAVNPSDLVLAAGLGPIAVPGYTIGPMRFARELLCLRGRERFRRRPPECADGVHFDIFDIHPYTTGGPTHEGGANDVELGDIPKLQRLLQEADRAGRIKGRYRHTPLWITELAWDSKPPDPGGLPMRILTRWAAEALYRVWKAGVSNFLWFSLRDAPYEPSRPFSETLQSGLYFRGATVPEDQPKRVMYAFRFPFVAYATRKGLFFWGRTPNSRGGRVAIQVERHGRWRQADVTHAAGNGIFTGLVRIDYGRRGHGAVRAAYRHGGSVPFSMKPIPDFPQPPFG